MTVFKKITNKIFGGLNMSWIAVLVFAVIMGAYTALVAIVTPEKSSFHDIAVVMSPWVLPALIVVTNCKSPFEAAIKTFVFFLVSQPLVYLIQVPFSSMGWDLFGYYPYWFKVTLLTLPAAFIAWFIKKDWIWAGFILSGALALMVLEGAGFAKRAINDFPYGLLSAIVILGLIPVFIFGILKNKKARIVACVATALIIAVLAGYRLINGDSDMQADVMINAEYGITVSNMGDSNVTVDDPDLLECELTDFDGMCSVRIRCKKTGEGHVIFENPDGEKFEWLIICEDDDGTIAIGHEEIELEDKYK